MYECHTAHGNKMRELRPRPGPLLLLPSDTFSSIIRYAAAISGGSSPEMRMGKKHMAASEALVRELVETVQEIAAIPDHRGPYKKQFGNLSRRIMLLEPMVEELRESRKPVPKKALRKLTPLKEALGGAKELLRLGSEGSKIFLVLEMNIMMTRFVEVSAQLENALGGISLDMLDISEEAKEQVDLVLTQFRRAKELIDMPAAELYVDLFSLYNNTNSKTNPVLLQRLTEELQLKTISDLKQESLALHELVVDGDGRDPGENLEKMSLLLRKISNFVLTQDPEMGSLTNPKLLPPSWKPQSPVISSSTKLPGNSIPNDFRCPICLELMKDPVIVATGQTYDRECIEKWLCGGNDTCPKTQLRLPNKSITPNYILRSLIAEWCEVNGIEPPTYPSQPTELSSARFHRQPSPVHALMQKLSSPDLDEKRSAIGDLRLLAKCNAAEDRSYIAEAGAIPLITNLLTTFDHNIQEHAVTTLLNLSIFEENKRKIIASGAVPGIVHVLKNGSMEARANAAATLFSLSVVDANKVTIGASGAIPALISLLNEGTLRGKKDAAAALFTLCIYQGNKRKAVMAGAVPIVMVFLMDPEGVLVDEMLAILALLSSHPDGKVAIGAVNIVPILVKVIGSGSPRSRENAAAILEHLCRGELQFQHLTQAQECGLKPLLLNLASNGTERGKRKSLQLLGFLELLERMQQFLDQQKEASQMQGQAERSSIPDLIDLTDL